MPAQPSLSLFGLNPPFIRTEQKKGCPILSRIQVPQHDFAIFMRFLSFFILFLNIFYIEELKKLSRIRLDILGLFSRERKEDIFVFL
jgi:hypothetical protein